MTSSKSTPPLVTRCSVMFLRNTMDRLRKENKIKEVHIEAIKATPFFHFFSLPDAKSLNLSFTAAVIKRFDPEAMAFRLGRNVILPFDAKEFSVVMGLQYYGQPISHKLRTPSISLTRLFGENKMRSLIVRKEIVEKMERILDSGRTSDEDISDFKILYIAFVFTTVLFPMRHFSIPLHLHRFFDNVDEINRFNWGLAVHRYVCASMQAFLKQKKHKNVDGCLIGVVAWLFERVPSLGISTTNVFSDRFMNWQGPIGDGNTVLYNIRKPLLVTFSMLPHERPFVDARHEEVSQGRNLEAEVSHLRAEIQRLDQRLEGLLSARGQRHDTNVSTDDASDDGGDHVVGEDALPPEPSEGGYDVVGDHVVGEDALPPEPSEGGDNVGDNALPPEPSEGGDYAGDDALPPSMIRRVKDRGSRKAKALHPDYTTFPQRGKKRKANLTPVTTKFD